MKRENEELKSRILKLLDELSDERERSTRNLVLKLLGKSPDDLSYTAFNRMMTLTRYYLKKLESEGLVVKRKKLNALVWSLKERGD